MRAKTSWRIRLPFVTVCADRCSGECGLLNGGGTMRWIRFGGYDVGYVWLGLKGRRAL